jgi:prepilin-type N-terminal cleavage/methylation domain-containing protein/prepilin-type processing-associated H-X9-DG protein
MNRFTLIELLVVIAIMGILSSMLLPSLKTARLSAMVAVCTSNQKQVSTAIMSYSITSDGIWPYSPQVTPDLVTASLPAGSKMTPEVIWEDGGGVAALYVCPLDPSPETFAYWAFTDRQYFTEENEKHSYMFNEWAGWLKARFQNDVYRLSDMVDPTRWPQVSDGAITVSNAVWNRCDPANSGQYGALDWWHPSERVNMLFGDGHVENISAYTAESYDPKE